jgi:hypothetical protein
MREYSYILPHIQNERNKMSIKYFTWYMKSREKVDTVRGVDEHENFKSKQWEDKNGNPCYNFWDIDAEHPRTAVNYTVRKA